MEPGPGPDVPLLHLLRGLHGGQGRDRARYRQEVRPLLPLRMRTFPSLETVTSQRFTLGDGGAD